jgi:hypothetical protein
MSWDACAGSKFAQEEAGSVGGVVGEVGKFDPWVGAGFPHGGVGQANGWKHFNKMQEMNSSDNPLG